MSSNNDAPSMSEFTDIGRGAMSTTRSNFTMVDNHTSTNSGYEVVSNADNWSEITSGQEIPFARRETEASTTGSATTGPVPKDSPTHALTLENMSLKEIDEVAGGSIQRYKELMTESMKQRTGVPFTADAAVPAPGEVIGDKKPGYEKMALGAKFWAW